MSSSPDPRHASGRSTPPGTIATEPFQFALHRWRSLVTAAWIPALLFAAVLMLGGQLAFDAEAMAETGGLAFRGHPALAILILAATAIVAGFLYSGVAASIFELVAVGETRTSAPIRRDGPTWRVFAAFSMLTVLSFAIWALATLIAVVASGGGEVIPSLQTVAAWSATASPGATPPADVIAAGERVAGAMVLLLAIGGLPSIYLTVRLIAFPAGSAIDNRLVPRKAFAVTEGRFWPILGGYLLLAGGMMLLGMVTQLGAAPLSMLSVLFAEQGGVGAALGAVLGAGAAALLIAVQVIGFVVQTAFAGVVYRRLAL